MLKISHDTCPLCTIYSAWPPRQAAGSSSVQPVLNSKYCLTTTAMLLLKHEPFQCYLTIKSRMKISCELKERRFGSRVISGGHYPQAGISVRARLKTFGCSQTKWSQSCLSFTTLVWKEDSPIQPSWKGMNKNGETCKNSFIKLNWNSSTTSDLVGVRWCEIFENILGIVVLSEGTMNYVSSCIVDPSCHLEDFL
jgi:hypothetical protein